MAIRAYAEDYLPGAQRVLGDAVDFAVMTLKLEPDTFGAALAVSDVGRQFASGNPKYVAGMNGCEFARLVLSDTGTAYTDHEDVMFLEKSPEYRAGWALAAFKEDLAYPRSMGIRALPACLIQCGKKSALVSGMIGLHGFMTVIAQLLS